MEGVEFKMLFIIKNVAPFTVPANNLIWSCVDSHLRYIYRTRIVMHVYHCCTSDCSMVYRIDPLYLHSDRQYINNIIDEFKIWGKKVLQILNQLAVENYSNRELEFMLLQLRNDFKNYNMNIFLFYKSDCE